MICILKKNKKRKAKLSSLLAAPTIRRGGITKANSPEPKASEPVVEKVPTEAPIKSPEISLPPPVKLDYIDNPSFHERGAEKKFPREEELALQERGLTSLVAPSTARRVSAPLALACETPLLTPQEEQRLFRRMNFCKFRAAKLGARSGGGAKAQAYTDEAVLIRNRIIRSNTRLVVSIAKSFVDLQNSFEDLFSDGVIGLVQAAEKFDYERGFRFSTYATRAIRRNLYRIVTNRRRDRTRFSTGALDSQTEPEEVDRGSTISEARWDDLQTRLRSMLSSLDPRERQIVRARFGLESTRDVLTLQCLAKKMGICKERVRQLEKRALDKLRLMASDVKLEEPDA